MKHCTRRNMSTLDRVLRSGVGLILIYVGFFDTTLIPDRLISGILGGIGIINVVVAMVGICPLYWMARLSTRSEKACEE